MTKLLAVLAVLSMGTVAVAENHGKDMHKAHKAKKEMKKKAEKAPEAPKAEEHKDGAAH